ncbi:helix-turn-helix domain-containing protein [Nonomuraea sp. NPDC059194]|uniref:helix-turn-helix domain-containing protein n=1 Tax=Nonomuraea sp. NPDC059194 TaxID=3346764 RepID=UPI0036C59B76
MLFLVAAMAAEMERDLISERTLDGLAAARAHGRIGGRPPALDADKLAAARERQAGGESITAIAKHLGVGRSTLYRALEGDGQPLGANAMTAATDNGGQVLAAPPSPPAGGPGSVSAGSRSRKPSTGVPSGAVNRRRSSGRSSTSGSA